MSASAAREETRGWRVAGRVQGVGFRWFVERAARRVGLRGEVRNLADGSVEILARGERENLATLEREIRSGPPASIVERVEAFEPPAGDEECEFDGFEIRV